MIPGIELTELIANISIWGVMFIVFAESGLLIGFFLPGDSLLFTTGFLISTGILPININLAVAGIAMAAIIGDSVGYAFGRRAGPSIFKKPDARIFKQSHIRNAQDFYEKHGGKTIILARFIPIIRTFAPIVAGVGKMNYRKFLSFNIIGGALWATVVTYVGFFLGKWFRSIGIDIDTILLPAIFLIIFISVLPPIIQILRDPASRKEIWRVAKRQFDQLIGKK